MKQNELLFASTAILQFMIPNAFLKLNIFSLSFLVNLQYATSREVKKKTNDHFFEKKLSLQNDR